MRERSGVPTTWFQALCPRRAPCGPRKGRAGPRMWLPAARFQRRRAGTGRARPPPRRARAQGGSFLVKPGGAAPAGRRRGVAGGCSCHHRVSWRGRRAARASAGAARHAAPGSLGSSRAATSCVFGAQTQAPRRPAARARLCARRARLAPASHGRRARRGARALQVSCGARPPAAPSRAPGGAGSGACKVIPMRGARARAGGCQRGAGPGGHRRARAKTDNGCPSRCLCRGPRGLRRPASRAGTSAAAARRPCTGSANRGGPRGHGAPARAAAFPRAPVPGVRPRARVFC